MFHIDGDFKSGKGDCSYHCSPTCHPGQIDPNEWHYGCLHKAWPQNRYGDFVPFVKCGGIRNNCDLAGTKILSNYLRGLKQRKNNAEKKVKMLIKQIKDIERLKNN